MRRLRSAVLVLVMFIALGTLGEDYLSPDLRGEVDQLIADFKQQPTNEANVKQRAEVFWRWSNAWSMDERYMPVNLTTAIASVLASPFPTRPRQHQALDTFIFELALLDADADAIGQLTADGHPFEVASYGTLTQTFTTGSRDIETGGGFLIGRHFMGGYRFQATDATQPNYISIKSDNPSVTFTQDSFPLGGMHGGFRGSVPALVFRVSEGTLTLGDQVWIVYGDTSQGSPGLRIPDLAIDFLAFPIYLALDESNQFLSLPIQPVTTHGTSVAGVHAFAPSVVEASEPFEISIRSRDRFYNRPNEPSPSWSLHLTHESGEIRTWTTKPNENAITKVAIKDLPTGVHYVSVESKSLGLSGYGNAILVEEDPEYFIYWGDTHGHSGFAEGLGTPERFMQWAKEDARLDFVTHSEHDIWMDDFEWQVLIKNVESYSDSEFIGFLGYEWTRAKHLGGHHNVLFRDFKDKERMPAQIYGTLSRLYQGLRANHDPNDVVVIPHAHQPGNYRLSDPELQPLVEIMSQHGSFEWFGQKYLEHGHEVGFTAASDNHLAQPGYQAPTPGGLSQRGGLGALLAKEKTRDSLFDAMKQINAYATSGDRIILRFDVNGTSMGQRIPMVEDRTISGEVIAAFPISKVAVVKNGKDIWQQDYLTSSGGEVVTEGRFKLSFSSSSVPHHPHDNPRGWRNWQGTLAISGAEVEEVNEQDFANLQSQRLAIREDGSIAFSTLTRGDSSSIDFTLSDINPDASMTINLQAGTEYGGGPPTFRPHQTFAAQSYTLPIQGPQGEKISQQVPATDYMDQITLRRIVDEGDKHVSFRLTDSGHLQGDYYYVRATLANDAQAWSSPVWVGGYQSR